MNIQPMIDELLLVRRGLSEVHYDQQVFRAKNSCGTMCCMAGLAAYRKVGLRFLKLDSDTMCQMGAELMGIKHDPDDPDDFDIFNPFRNWPTLIADMYGTAVNEKTRIDAAICALRVMNRRGCFGRMFRGRHHGVPLARQRRVIRERLREVFREEQELAALKDLYNTVADNILAEAGDFRNHKEKDGPKKLPQTGPNNGRKRVAVTKP